MRKYLKIIFGLSLLLKEWCLNAGRLKIHGVHYCVCSGVRFWTHNGGSCDIGMKSWFSENCLLESNGGKIKLGFNNFFNSNCHIIALSKIVIGDNNLFGPNVVIVDHNHNYSKIDELICRQGFKTIPVNIGSDIWIGSNVTICAGSDIGDHIIVAANSVVKGRLSIPGIYAGNPAKLVKKR